MLFLSLQFYLCLQIVCMEQPLFSIITITFNAEKELPATLDSVRCQSFRNFEYLVIDGKSNDSTVGLAKESGIKGILIVSEPDNGLYDAMNKGIRKAKGRYLIFLNAGDAFHSPDSLSEIAVAAEANGFPDVVYGQTQLVDASRKFVAMRHLSAPEHLTFESFRQGMLVCHQAFVVKREIAEPYDLRYRFSADYEWCLRCLKKMKGSAYTGTVIIDYLTDGLTDKNHMASLKERFPEADFLLTTPPGSYWRKRVKKTLKNGRKTYVTRHILNEQVEQVAQTQVAYGAEHGIPVWDLYHVVGGADYACRNWRSAGLQRSDYIHYTPEGYILQGKLLAEAILKAYYSYETNIL